MNGLWTFSIRDQTLILSQIYSEQCQTLVAATFKSSCKTGEGVDEMFSYIAMQLVESNRSKFELEKLTENNGVQITHFEESDDLNKCSC